jgi:hypothetical protein
VHGDQIADEHRLAKIHRFDRYRDGPGFCDLGICPVSRDDAPLAGDTELSVISILCLQFNPSTYFDQRVRGYLETVDCVRGIARHE